MESLASTVRGHGPEVMLIHGGMTDGELAWGAQEQLAERWRLRVVDRAGYGNSAHLSTGEDIHLDTRDSSRPHLTSLSISLATRLVRSSPSSWLPPRRAACSHSPLSSLRHTGSLMIRASRIWLISATICGTM